MDKGWHARTCLVCVCTGYSQEIRRATENPTPSVAIADSTFVESGYGCKGSGSSGYKNAKGVTLHVVIDKHRDVLAASVQAANVSDAAAACDLIKVVCEHYPSVTRLLGDKAYDKDMLKEVVSSLNVALDATSPALPKGVTFQPMPLRWRIEQFFGWLSRWRRLAKNWCYSIQCFEAEFHWCLLGLNFRRLLHLVG